MLLKKILPLVLLASVFSCNSEKITKTEDYNEFLTTKINQEELHENVNFWSNKLDKNNDNYIYLAKRSGAYNQIFSQTKFRIFQPIPKN